MQSKETSKYILYIPVYFLEFCFMRSMDTVSIFSKRFGFKQARKNTNLWFYINITECWNVWVKITHILDLIAEWLIK
jgi:hypothetical protein